MSENKPWGQVAYEAFVSRFEPQSEPFFPPWSSLDDARQSGWEEHARLVTMHVSEKYFPGDPETQQRAFDLGEGNLDLSDHLFTD